MSRIRTNLITNRMANGAPTVSNGLVISGVTTTSDIKVGTGVTLNVYGGATFSGIVTATSFVGGLPITNGADNRVITATGTNAIQGEANLTFDGTTLGLTGNQTVSGTVQVAGNSNFGAAAASPSPSALTVKMATNKHIGFSPSQSEVGDVPALVAFQDNGSLNSIGFRGTDLRFAAGSAERFRIASTGQVSISSDGTTDGLLTIKGNSDQVATPSIRLLDGSDTREVSITNTSGDFVVSVHGNDNAIHGHIKMFESGIIDFNNGGASGSNTNRLRIDTSGNVTKPSQPSFTARSTGTWSHGSSTGYLDIDINMVEEFDVGGNYNGQIFTAPVAGKYFFSYTFQYKCTSGYLVVSLRKGVGGSYNSYGRMHVYPPQQSSIYTGPGIIGIIDLAAGNTVKPVAEVNYAGNQVANVNFSGYLLG